MILTSLGTSPTDLAAPGATLATSDPVALALARLTGALIGPAGEALIERRCSALGMGRAAYAQLLVNDPIERQQVVELCLDLTTGWWRHAHVVDDFEQRFLPLIAKRQSRTHRPEIRIWVAGCSTGEDAWSIAGSLIKGIPDIDCWDVTLLGTDLHTGALATASVGAYAETAIPGARVPLVFDRARSGHVIVQRRVRAFTSFAWLNLAEPEWPAIGSFDAIICTDVIPRLVGQDGASLVRRLAACLRQAGTLYVDQDARRPTMDFALRQPAPGVFSRPLA